MNTALTVGPALDLDLTLGSANPFCLPGRMSREPVVMDEIETLMRAAAGLGSSGALARKRGDEAAADVCFGDALRLAVQATNRAGVGVPLPRRLETLRRTVLLALDCGEVTEARRLMDEALDLDPSVRFSDERVQVLEVATWSDGWLIAAIRRDPPDVAALNVLADRYWKALFGRCQMLTLNPEKASDLAQQAWCRVLRARNKLKPGGNFPAYLMTIATNLWRDANRSARRAGPMADHRLASLDAALATEDGESAGLAEMLPDLNALQTEEQNRLALDIDQALERLTPLLRDVLVSRLISGESCAEIGRRYDRTEQTISAWVRQAVREVKQYLEAVEGPTERENQS